MAKKMEAGLREYEAALTLAGGTLPALCAAVGPDAFLRAEAAAAFRDAWLASRPDGDVVTLRGSGEARVVRLPDVLREMSGGSLFSRDKLIMVRQAERVLFPGAAGGEGGALPSASGGKPGGPETIFLERAEDMPGGIWLFLETASLPRNRTLGKKLAELVTEIPCPQPTARDIPRFLHGRAKALGRGLDEAAADLLMRAYGTDLGLLTGELDKLALFAPEGRDIDAGMVGEFLTGTIEYDIFAFTNAVEARDPAEAMYYARRIASQGARDQKGKREDGEKTAHKVMAILSGNIAQMLKARIAMAAGETPEVFARDEKLSPWRAGRLFESAGRYSLPELRRMTVYLTDQIRRTHDTGGDVLFSLETSAVILTRKNGA